MSALRVMFGGDTMLGRNVGDAIAEEGAAYPLAPIAGLLRGADLSIVNLECAITASPQIWSGAPKAFYFGAPPEAVATLRSAGIDAVSLANNHALDYGETGLIDTLGHLAKAGIRASGAGADLAQALVPAFLERNATRLAMVAFCNHQRDFAASPTQAGIAWLDLDDEDAALAAFSRGLDAIRASGPCHWPTLSLHWGPNFAPAPATRLQKLARAAIDLGYGIVFGHSAHHFQGIEIYRNRPILYATGDLVDDYMVDPYFRNDLQLLFELTLTQERLESIRLYPVRIDRCQTSPADGADLDFIVSRMRSMCAPFGTRIEYHAGALRATWGAENQEGEAPAP